MVDHYLIFFSIFQKVQHSIGHMGTQLAIHAGCPIKKYGLKFAKADTIPFVNILPKFYMKDRVYLFGFLHFFLRKC